MHLGASEFKFHVAYDALGSTDCTDVSILFITQSIGVCLCLVSCLRLTYRRTVATPVEHSATVPWGESHLGIL